MKGPNGVEWYNVIIIILAVIGVFVNTCSLVVLIKKRKNSMFYKLLKVNTMYPDKFWLGFFYKKISKFDDMLKNS